MKAFGLEITFSEVERFFKSWISRLLCFCLCVLCAIMAFAPEHLVERLQLVGLRARLGAWLGILLVASLASLVISIFHDLIMAYKMSRQFKGKDADRRMEQLSPVALGYLCEMYLSPDYAKHFDTTSNPSFQALYDSKMIRVAAWGEVFNYPCYLQPWVVRWFDSHQDIVEQYKKKTLRKSRGESDLSPY